MSDKQWYQLIGQLDWKWPNLWSMAYTPWGERIICHLTVAGVTRSGVGEDNRKAFRDAAMLFAELRDYLEE